MTLHRPIYLDHHATTPVDPRVLEVMLPYFTEEYGNPSSASHAFGWAAEAAVADARERLAAALGAADPNEITFTSGTTESDNMALLGVARSMRSRRDHIITSSIEHPAVLDVARVLEREGFSISLLPVDGDGLVDPDAVKAAIGDRTALVSVMTANSEIGVLQPVAEIGRICREREVLFHTDAAQAVGKVPVNVDDWGIDLLSFCAHKLYGPKGVGALYVRSRRPRTRLEPLMHGGGHEHGLRPGTVPVPLVVGFAKAVELCIDGLEAEARRMREMRDRLWDRLRAEVAGVHLNGHAVRRLPGNLNISFDGVEADPLLVALHGVALSTGSACSSASPEPSHVLRALQLPEERIRGALRVGIGRGNTLEEIDRVADQLIEQVAAARAARGGPRLRSHQ